jgi:hypothetical protein
MSVSKFMLGGSHSDPLAVLNVIDGAYRLAGKEFLGTTDIGLEDTVGEAKSIAEQVGTMSDNVRVFRVTVEEVQ